MIHMTIPTLFVNKDEMRTPQEVISYLLKFMMHNPGWTSSQIEGGMLSMRKFAAETSENINALPGMVESILSSAINKHFPNYSVKVNATVMPDQVTYRMSILVMDTVGEHVFGTDDFIVRDGKLMLNVEAENERRM